MPGPFIAGVITRGATLRGGRRHLNGWANAHRCRRTVVGGPGCRSGLSSLAVPDAQEGDSDEDEEDNRDSSRCDIVCSHALDLVRYG